MTLEQRIEVLERAVKALVGGEFVIKDGQVFIHKAFIQDGATKAAITDAANYALLASTDYESERDRKMDLITASMRGSQALSHL